MKLVGPSLARPEPPDARPRAEAARSAPAPRAPSPLPEAPMAARPSPAGAGFLQSFTPAGIGAAVGRLAKLAGVAAVGAMIAACSTLPHVDASVGCTPIYGAPLTQLEAPAQPNPSAGPSKVSVAFEGLKTIGGGPAHARLLEDNLHAWNARWEMLEGATARIDATYFIMEKDPFGYAFLGHLLKKQRAGVDVRVMIDAMADTFGTHGFKMPARGKDYLQELAGAGSFVGIYHPIHHRPFEFTSYAFMASNHDKILAVDDRWSMTGGRNIGIEYFAHPADMPAAWRDTDLIMDGAGPAKALVAAMDAELAHEDVVSKVVPDRLGNWVKRDLELIGAYAMMDLWLKDPALSAADKARLRADPGARAELAKDLVARALARLPADGVTRKANDRERGFLLEQATTLVGQLETRGSRARYEADAHAAHASDVKILDQTSVAGARVNDFDVALVALANAATKSIYIENPYVVLTEEMIVALEQASLRGVEVIIGTNSPLSTDSAVTQAFFLEDWAYILARVPTARIFVAAGERKLHAKVATIDDELSIVSTYNMDLLSGYVNSEVGAVVRSRAFNADMKAVFVRDRDEPANGVLEYKILKDATGKAILRGGAPVPVFGPEDHLPQEILKDYAGRRETWGKMRDTLPYFRPLRHPKLGCGPDLG